MACHHYPDVVSPDSLFTPRDSLKFKAQQQPGICGWELPQNCFHSEALLRNKHFNGLEDGIQSVLCHLAIFFLNVIADIIPRQHFSCYTGGA